jgi:hypothetical protein
MSKLIVDNEMDEPAFLTCFSPLCILFDSISQQIALRGWHPLGRLTGRRRLLNHRLRLFPPAAGTKNHCLTTKQNFKDCLKVLDPRAINLRTDKNHTIIKKYGSH